MKVILHIGLPKTGSSYIQEWLRVNSQAVPSLPLDGSSRLATECCDAIRFNDRLDFQSINNMSFSAVKEQITNINKRDFDRFIISSEYFYLAKPIDIAKVFSELGLEVERIICFLRRQDDLIASGYAQEVKALSRTDPFDLDKCLDTYDWFELQSDYKSAFPDADFVPLEFDYLRKNKKLLLAFKCSIGCSADTIDKLPGGDLVNRSLPGELVEICRLGNQSGDNILNEFSLYASSCGIVNAKYQLPRYIREELKLRYSKSNDAFVSSIKNPREFYLYTSDNWHIDGVDSDKHLSPELICRLLRFAILNMSDEGHKEIYTPRGHGHGFRGKRC